MSDRILRANILTSDSVNSLSWGGEVFYRRLMSVVDDYGRYDARTSILRADLYALKLSKVSESDIVKWMNECSEAGLVRFYEVDEKKYLELLKFGQRLRAMKSKYPSPSDKRCQMPTNDNKCLLKRRETETETETETKENSPPDFSIKLKADQLFFEQLAHAWNLNKQTYQKIIEAFVLFLASKNKSHSDYGEFKNHFFNWSANKYQNFKVKEKSMVD